MNLKEVLDYVGNLDEKDFTDFAINSPINNMAFDAMMVADRNYNKFEETFTNDVYNSMDWWWENMLYNDEPAPSVEEKKRWYMRQLLVVAYYKSISKLTDKFTKLLEQYE